MRTYKTNSEIRKHHASDWGKTTKFNTVSTKKKRKKKIKAKSQPKLPYESPLELRKLSYPEFLKSKYWAAVRKTVLTRDNNECRICKSKLILQVHHETYKHHFNELNHLADLITLCKKCHKEHHYAQN